ncbi:MAG: hypothetical protein KDA52_16455, partial [Planctomycetaceae bacterium]|nr:hypothetical protein [Planctomycetaceae bacterium]
YARLGRQPAGHVGLQREVFKEGDRGGRSAAHLLAPAVRNLSEEDMQDVSAYYSSLSSAR